jgi:hypothetical protein
MKKSVLKITFPEGISLEMTFPSGLSRPEMTISDGGKSPLSYSQKREILERHDKGQTASSIAKDIGIDGRRVQGVIRSDQLNRERKTVKAEEPAAPYSVAEDSPGGLNNKIAPVAELPVPQEVKVEHIEKANIGPMYPAKRIKEDKKPEPIAMSRAALDGVIYDMYVKDHMTCRDISEELNSQGLYYSAEAVRNRLRMIGVDASTTMDAEALR